MNKSESIKELATALSKAQEEMTGAKKGKENPFYKSTYADLKAVIDCAKEALSNHGLSISQCPLSHEGKAGVQTLLMHSSGEWIESTLLLACTKQDPQAMGSAITYARRYAYQSILGIPSEDDDGNKSMPAPKKKAQPAPAPAPKKQYLTQDQFNEIVKLAHGKDLTALNKHHGIAQINHMEQRQFEQYKKDLMGMN